MKFLQRNIKMILKHLTRYCVIREKVLRKLKSLWIPMRTNCHRRTLPCLLVETTQNIKVSKINFCSLSEQTCTLNLFLLV